MDIHALENKIHQMVDDLQGLCSTVGLSNTAHEEVVVTSVFLYKFLNDKFMYNMEQFAKEISMSVNDILKNINNKDFDSLDSADNLYYNDYNYNI